MTGEDDDMTAAGDIAESVRHAVNYMRHNPRSHQNSNPIKTSAITLIEFYRNSPLMFSNHEEKRIRNRDYYISVLEDEKYIINQITLNYVLNEIERYGGFPDDFDNTIPFFYKNSLINRLKYKITDSFLRTKLQLEKLKKLRPFLIQNKIKLHKDLINYMFSGLKLGTANKGVDIDCGCCLFLDCRRKEQALIYYLPFYLTEQYSIEINKHIIIGPPPVRMWTKITEEPIKVIPLKVIL